MSSLVQLLLLGAVGYGAYVAYNQTSRQVLTHQDTSNAAHPQVIMLDDTEANRAQMEAGRLLYQQQMMSGQLRDPYGKLAGGQFA